MDCDPLVIQNDGDFRIYDDLLTGDELVEKGAMHTYDFGPDLIRHGEIVDYGDTIFEASSYGEVSTCVPEYRPDMQERRLDVLPSAIPGDFYATHFVAGSGITLDWFMNTFVKHDGLSTKEMFAQMEKEMADIEPGCNGLMAIGLLGGNSMPSDGAIRGMWMGYDWSHSKAHFYKALIESFTYDFTLCLQSIERLYPEYDIERVKIIGGGAK